MSSQKKFTKRQHYIPQFLLKNFTDSANKILLYNKESGGFRNPSSPKSVMYAENLYEFMDTQTPKCISNNIFETRFSEIESLLSPELGKFIQNGCVIRKQQEEILCMMLVALQLIRQPSVFEKIKKLDEPEQLPIAITMYYDKAIASQYLKRCGLNPFAASCFIDEFGDMLSRVLFFFMNNRYVKIMQTDKIPFLISDKPVLVNEFSDATHIYPISSYYAIALMKRPVLVGVPPFVCPDLCVFKINYMFMNQTTKYIGGHPKCKNLISHLAKVVNDADFYKFMYEE